MLELLIFISFITVVIDFILVILSTSRFKKANVTPALFPKISIIIAARNEEKTLSRCLKAILSLDYPKDKVEVLVGNDDSEDKTLEIATRYSNENPSYIKVFDIKSNIQPHLKGKPNILAYLCREAEGEFFLFTDADTEIPSTWATIMVANFQNEIGIITGFTGISGYSIFHKFQNIDWCFALGMVKVITDYGKPVTAMGNNMAVSKEAYWSVGGYEGIPFSITEDLELSKQIIRKGFKAKNLLDERILAWSLPAESFLQLLKQRKRWMSGAMELPVHMVLVLFFQALFFPSILILLYFKSFLAIFIFLLKVFLQTTFLSSVFKKLNLKIDLKNLVIYEFYSVFLSLSLMVYYIIPTKVEWKGRKY
jgi:cellulose synthase/poly-beta-1,6-N-acetylglucosamine synthase-like glycosyltransferase